MGRSLDCERAGGRLLSLLWGALRRSRASGTRKVERLLVGGQPLSAAPQVVGDERVGIEAGPGLGADPQPVGARAGEVLDDPAELGEPEEQRQALQRRWVSARPVRVEDASP